MIAVNHSRRYINQNIWRMPRIFKWAVSRELVPVAVHQALSTVDLRKGKSNAWETKPVPLDELTIEKKVACAQPTNRSVLPLKEKIRFTHGGSMVSQKVFATQKV